jgi:broad specificity phosphatase PhoE
MKWPYSVTLTRHDTSVYNNLKKLKANDPLYKEFLVAFKNSPHAEETKMLARKVKEKFSLGCGDADTPLADIEGRQAFETGQALSSSRLLPDVIFVSPYKRTLDTLGHIIRGWPELSEVKVVEEERVREQEHGLSLIYNDWRVFHTLHPDQAELYKIEGPYWYRFPQGENVPDVRERNRSFITTLVRDFSHKNVLVITHHLNILAMRANLERLGATEFLRLDKEEKPINCGVTRYFGNSTKGTNGQLVLDYYNKKLYS